MGGDFNSTRNIKPKKSRFENKNNNKRPFPSIPIVDSNKDSTNQEENKNEESKLETESPSPVPESFIKNLEDKFSLLISNLSDKIQSKASTQETLTQEPSIKAVVNESLSEPLKVNKVMNIQSITSSNQEEEQKQVSPFLKIINPKTQTSNLKSLKLQGSSSSSDFFSNPSNVALVQALIIIAIVFLSLAIVYLLFLFTYKSFKIRKYRPYYY